MKNLFLIVFFFAQIFVSTGYSKPPKIALHFSKKTQLLNDQLIEKLTYWELFLINNKIEYDVIDDKDLESGIEAEKYPLILFFSTIAFSQQSFNELTRYIEHGGSVLSFGEFITHNEKLITTGWERFESIFGVRFDDRIPKSKMSVTLDFADYLPISNDVRKLTDIRVTTKNSPIIAEPLSNKCKPIALFNDNREFPNKISAAAVVLFYNNSYRVWYSIDPSEIVGGKDDIHAFEQMILNTIFLIRGDNIAWVESQLDNNYRPVFVLFDLTVDTKQSEDIIKIIKELDLYPGFIISSFKYDIENIKLLSQRGDIVLYLKMPAKNLTKTSSKEDYIEKQLNIFQKITGRNINSVYFHSDSLNDTVIRILKKNKIKNLFVSSPVISSTWDDGINVIHLSGTNNLRFRQIEKENQQYSLEKFYLDDLSRKTFSDKIPAIVYKTFPDCTDSELQRFGKFLKVLKQSRNRIISVDEYIQLTEFGKELKISITQTENEIIELYLTNRSNTSSNKVEVNFTSWQIRNCKSVSIVSDQMTVDYFFDQSSGLVKIFLENLKRNSTLKFDVSLKR
jgi:hypothetical protein